MLRRRPELGAMVLALALAGCAEGTDFTGQACDPGSPCPGDFVCSPLTSMCHEGCEEDDDCGEAESCIDSACLPDVHCLTPGQCNPSASDAGRTDAGAASDAHTPTDGGQGQDAAQGQDVGPGGDAAVQPDGGRDGGRDGGSDAGDGGPVPDAGADAGADGGHEPEPGCHPCVPAPASGCLRDDSAYRALVSTGPCPDAGLCYFDSIDVPCSPCSSACAHLCDGVLCEPQPGSCAQSSYCEPNGAMGTAGCVDLPAPDGTPCEVGGIQGACQSASCQTPDSPCEVLQCSAGSCAIVPATMGTSCTADSNPCTSDACDGAGNCVASALADGASCGGNGSARCCGSQCVDISTNEDHCGGCNTACGQGLNCEPVSNTIQCSSAPSGVTGRCLCSGANLDCPRGQICRGLSPYADRCAPENVGDCAANQSFVDVSGCPNYCRY